MLLEADNLNFSYGVQPALQNVSLSLAGGEVVALLGPNGSGKSTLLRVLLGLCASAGAVRWDGIAVQQLGPKRLATRAAYLAQTPTFDPGSTVADVLQLGRAPYWGAFGIESARDAQVVADVAEQLELTPLLARPIDQLSGGQRQRVFLGRCLVQEPAAILLDEPSTYLDLKHQVALAHLLRRLAREGNLGILMASHDLNLTLGVADRLILLDQGTIAFTGTPQTLSADVLSAVYGLPMTRLDGPTGRPVFVPSILD